MFIVHTFFSQFSHRLLTFFIQKSAKLFPPQLFQERAGNGFRRTSINGDPAIGFSDKQ
jgi:hypothetical protein